MAGELVREFRGLDKCMVVGFTGIPAVRADEVRAELETRNVRLRVVKNSLAAVALREAGIAQVADLLDGPSAIMTGGQDVVDLVKAASGLAERGEGFTLLGGYGEGRVLSAAQVEVLSKIPGREELLRSFAWAISSTLSNFAGVLGALQRNFVYALNSLKEKKT